jgi:hypothetical protein
MVILLMPRPVMAGTLDIDITGLLGPVLQGSDPIHLAGVDFSATGEIDANAVPIFVAGDSSTYDLVGNLQITLGQLALTGYNPQLTITTPPSGPDTAVIDFGIVEFGFTPVAEAFLTLPQGTLSSSAVQPFGASLSEPDSNLSYTVPGQEDAIYATLGITGNVSVGGVAPASAPEPGTIGLLAAGLAMAAAMKRVRQKLLR